MAALTPYEKELFDVVVSRVAGSINDSVIDNAITQVLREKKVPGYWGHLRRLLNERVLRKNRQAKKHDTRPRLVLTA